MVTKIIDALNDDHKIMLMQDGFVFDKDNHDLYGDVSAEELPNGNGYTTGGYLLQNVAVTLNDVDDRTEISWDNPFWNAGGGPIGPSPGAIIYNNTVAAPLKPIAGYIDFGGNRTQADGGVATIADPMIWIRTGK